MIGLYARVSTTEQARDGYSIGEQQKRLKSYCDALGWDNYRVYVDAGLSGASMERPSLQSLIRDVKHGLVNKVIVYKLDRLSRSQKDTLYLIEDVFLANGCEFVSISENFDTSSPFGRAMVGILAVFAQLEREQIKERMMMGLEARAKDGKYIGSRIPCGYTYLNGKLLVDDFEKMQVVTAFESYRKGMTPKRIAEMLNGSGMHSKYGKWNAETIRTMLSNKVYLGYINFGDKVYKGEHEPIIDKELFDAVQEEHERRRANYINHKRLGKATSYLGGLIYCGCCGAKYSKKTVLRHRISNPYKEYYYVCNSRSKRVLELVKDPNCTNKDWSMEELDRIIFEEVRKLATEPINNLSNLKGFSRSDSRESVIKSEIEKIDDKLIRLMELFTIDKMPVDILQKKVEDLTEQKENLQEELHRLETIPKGISQEDAIECSKTFSDVLDRGDFDEIRSVLTSLIDRIVVDGDDITIHWNFN